MESSTKVRVGIGLGSWEVATCCGLFMCYSIYFISLLAMKMVALCSLPKNKKRSKKLGDKLTLFSCVERLNSCQ